MYVSTLHKSYKYVKPPSPCMLLNFRYSLSGPEVMRFAKIRIEFYRFIHLDVWQCTTLSKQTKYSQTAEDLEKKYG